MHKEKFLSCWLREGVEEEQAEMERLKKEAKHEESRSGKRELDDERREVEIKRRCLDRVSSEVLENFSPTFEVESVGVSFGFSVCVLVVPHNVLDVTVLSLW